MIIDDERYQREHTYSLVNKIFWDSIEIVAEAGDVDEAIQKIRQHKPSILFLDIELMTGTGFDVLDAFKDDPDYAHLEAIVISTVTHYVRRRLDLKAIVQVLEKPLTADKFRETVEGVMRKEPRFSLPKNEHLTYRKKNTTLPPKSDSHPAA